MGRKQRQARARPSEARDRPCLQRKQLSERQEQVEVKRKIHVPRGAQLSVQVVLTKEKRESSLPTRPGYTHEHHASSALHSPHPREPTCASRF